MTKIFWIKPQKYQFCLKIENGGKKLDCYEGMLSDNYMLHGFVPICKTPFDDKFAPVNWNFDRDGRPDIYIFVHNGDSNLEIIKKRKENSYVINSLLDIPSFHTYSEAYIYRDTFLKKEQYQNKKKKM